MLLLSCFIEWDFVAVIANDTPADWNASHLVFHPNPRIVPYIFILYCVILKPTLQRLFYLTMELSVIQFFPPHEQSDSNWSFVCSHYQGIQRPFLNMSEQFWDGRRFSYPCFQDSSVLKQAPYDCYFPLLRSWSERANLRLHPSALVLWVQSTMYSRTENKNVVVFLLFWDLLK